MDSQDLNNSKIQVLKGLIAEMLEMSENWPAIAYSSELSERARAAIEDKGG